MIAESGVDVSELNLKGKRVGVYGYGITGQAVVRALIAQGASAVVFDDRDAPAIREKLEKLAEDSAVEFHLTKWDADAQFARLNMMVVSPGIRSDNDSLILARKMGLEVISEIELGWRAAKGTLIAVTGSNGKSTTTALTGEIVRRALVERKGSVYVAGNIGSPFIDIAFQTTGDDVTVLEVSSYQLEAMPTFHPHIAIYTNVTPDHLERHGTFETYAAIKRSMVKHMNGGDFVIYNYEDANLQPELFPNGEPQYLAFTSAGASFPDLGAWLEQGEILVNTGRGVIERYPQGMVKLKGLHNVENTMCALLAGRLMNVASGTIIEAVEAFQGFPHRIEFVRELGGVRWYNDSKATNPESTLTALKSFDEPIILILGGRDKGTSLDALARLVRSKVERAILIGESAGRFGEALRETGFGNIEYATSVQDAVKLARHSAREGRIVLFSPACASFDMFTSFEERGNVFRDFVRSLPEVG